MAASIYLVLAWNVLAVSTFGIIFLKTSGEVSFLRRGWCGENENATLNDSVMHL